MERLTAERVNGIKTGFWSSAKKEDLVQRLGRYEDLAERARRVLETKDTPWRVIEDLAAMVREEET